MKRIIYLFVVMTLGGWLSSPAQAVTNTWSGAGGNNLWSTSGNWSSDPSGTTDTMFFAGAGVISNINLDSSRTIGEVLIGSGQGVALTITNSSSSLTIGTGGVDMADAGANLTVNVGTVTLGSSQSWNVGTSRTLTISSIVNGSGMSLTKSGAGMVTLSGANTYTGATVITNGVLQIANTSQISGTSGVSINSAGTLTVTAAPNGSWTRPVSGAGVWNLNGSPGNWTHFTGTGVLSGFTGTLNIGTGVGPYGDNASLYPGAGATINIAAGGELNIGGGGAVTTPTGTINLNGGSGAAWDVTGTAIRILAASVVQQNVNVNADTTIGCYTGQGGGTFTGNFALNGAALTVKIPASLTINGAFSGNGTLTTSNGGYSYRMFLGGNSSGFTGTFLPGPASPITFTSSAAGSASAVAQAGLSGGNQGFFEWGSTSSGTVQLGALTDGGYPTGYLQNFNPNNSTTGTFEIGMLNTSTTFSGTIRDSFSAGNSKIAIRKVGNGTLTLTGVNTYTGGTTISGGALQFSNSSVVGPIVNNGTLIITNTNALTLANTISGTGGLTKTGSGVLTLAAINTYHGPTVLNDGTLRLAATQLPSGLKIMPLGDSITYGSGGSNAGYRGPLYNLLNPVVPDFQFVGIKSENPGSLPATPLDERQHNGLPSYTLSCTSSNLDGLDMTVYNTYGATSRNPDGGYWLDGGHGTGRGALSPDIILLLLGANDVPNMTGIQNRMHDLYMKLLTNRPNAHLIIADATPRTDTYAGTTTNYNTIVNDEIVLLKSQGFPVSRCDLWTGYPASAFTDGVHPNDTGYNWMAVQWYNAILATVTGISGAIPADSPVTVAAGATLDLHDTQATIGSLTGNGNVLLGSGLLSINSSTDSTFGGVISGNGEVVKAGSGALTLTGTNTFTGDTIISNGTLVVNGSLSSPVTVMSGAILGGTGTISNTAVLMPGAFITVSLPGSALSVSSNLTIAGTINITDAGGFGPGTYTIFTYSGTLTNNGLAVGAIPNSAFVYALDTNTAGQVKLNVALSPFGAWQTEHFGSYTNAAAAADADPDKDGMNNWDEYLAGTGPSNALSRLMITNAMAGGMTGHILVWPGVSNHVYSVERSTNLMDGFTGIISNLPWMDPINTATDDFSSTPVFYRIKAGVVP